MGFKRQVPIGGYIADFVAASEKLVVEVDGYGATRRSQHDDPAFTPRQAHGGRQQDRVSSRFEHHVRPPAPGVGGHGLHYRAVLP